MLPNFLLVWFFLPLLPNFVALIQFCLLFLNPAKENPNPRNAICLSSAIKACAKVPPDKLMLPLHL